MLLMRVQVFVSGENLSLMRMHVLVCGWEELVVGENAGVRLWVGNTCR